MSESILPPKSNTVFQLLFGDQRNVELLADFLQSVLDIPEDEYQDIGGNCKTSGSAVHQRG